MKDYLAQRCRELPDPLQGKNFLREYLQARILGGLQRAGAMIPLAFHGGSALRFLHALPRYSEDLDFTLERAEQGYDLFSILRAIKAELSAEGYRTTFKANARKTVHAAFVRFPGLPYELGLSPHRREVFSVKLEVDTRPPAGAGLATTVVRRHVTLQLQHHDRASLFAGKLHSVLSRPYTKGRDIFDLFWYLAGPTWPAPNFLLLNNALHQTRGRGEEVDAENWRGVVAGALRRVQWARLASDVAPFLEPSGDVGVLTLPNALRLLGESEDRPEEIR